MKISGSIGLTLIGKQIVLGVTGSIAAYKAVSLLRTLLREGAIVHVVMTQSATKFITPLTFEVLSGYPVSTDVFDAHQEMKHVSLPEQADAIVIAPATANCLANRVVEPAPSESPPELCLPLPSGLGRSVRKRAGLLRDPPRSFPSRATSLRVL